MAADLAARASYGRLLSLLARDWRDLAAAEDALAEAFRLALDHWPSDGVPARPEAWLLTTARRQLIDGRRRQTIRAAAEPTLTLLAEQDASADGAAFPDERLKLLFVCAHPAIDAAARAPLMLQAVLGLDAARIAFVIPEQTELAGRLDAVLQAIYAAYGSGWDDIAGADPRRRGLAEEAIWLARLVIQLLPEEPEARGLLALMLHGEARREARRSSDGAFVPLAEQDTARWSAPLIKEAEAELAQAARHAALGPFQLEAAIQSVHAARAVTGRTDATALARLYEGLARLAPTTGVLVSRAAALAEASDPQAGLSALAELPPGDVLSYQPYWALRAHLLRRSGQDEAARDAYDRAIGLSSDPAVRDFLMQASRRPPD